MEGRITIQLTTKEADQLHYELDRLLAHAGEERDTKITSELYKFLSSYMKL